MDNKLVSVIIPTHGRPLDLLRRSVDSALNQDYAFVEVLVVDDNPLDSPLSADIRTYCASRERLRYLKTFGNRGACAARNLGVANALGEYAGFLDDDDEWLPMKVRVSLPHFTGDVAMVGTRGWTQRGEAEETRVAYTCDGWLARPTFETLLRRDTVGTTTLAIIDRARLIECGGFREDLPARQDYELWLRISRKYQIVLDETFAFVHYIHASGQITDNPKKALRGFQLVYREFKKDFCADRQARFSIWFHFKECYLRIGDRPRQAFCYLRMLLADPGKTLRRARERGKTEQ